MSTIDTDCGTLTNSWEYGNIYTYRGGPINKDDRIDIFYVRVDPNVTVIPNKAFDGCKQLASIYFPHNTGLTRIGDKAFSKCQSLKYIKLPTSIRTIGTMPFVGCNQLSTVEFFISTGEKDVESNQDVKICNNILSYCSTVEKIRIPIDVKIIGQHAFDCCTRLTTIEFVENKDENDDDDSNNETSDSSNGVNPSSNSSLSSLTTIEDYAFRCCTSLSSIPGILSPSSSSSLRYIGNFAFEGCFGLTDITIPNSIQYIGEGVFSGCNGLTSIKLPSFSSLSSSSNDPSSSSSSSSAAAAAAGTGTVLPARLFQNCRGLTNVDFSARCDDDTDTTTRDVEASAVDENDSDNDIFASISKESNDYNNNNNNNNNNKYILKKIGSHAFEGCSNLTNLLLPSTLEEIDDMAFASCYGIRSVDFFQNKNDSSSSTKAVLFSNLRRIGKGAFKQCFSLTKFSIPPLMTEIESSTFEFCMRMTEIHFPTYDVGTEKIATAKQTTASRMKINEEELGGKENEVLSGIRKIGGHAFRSCTGLTTIQLPIETLEEIGPRAFDGCTRLTDSIFIDSIPNCTKLGFIKEGAFRGCQNITTITNLPPLINYIDDMVFEGCIGLTRVDLTKKIDKDDVDNNNINCNDNVTCLAIERIGKGSFRDCIHLRSIKLPSSLKVIDDFAFSRCTMLSTVHLPTSIQRIGKAIFYKCLPKYSSSLSSYQEEKTIIMNLFSSLTALTIVTMKRMKKEGINNSKSRSTTLTTKMAVVELPVLPITTLDSIIADDTTTIRNDDICDDTNLPINQNNAHNTEKRNDTIMEMTIHDDTFHHHHHHYTFSTTMILQFFCDVNLGGRCFLERKQCHQQERRRRPRPQDEQEIERENEKDDNEGNNDHYDDEAEEKEESAKNMFPSSASERKNKMQKLEKENKTEKVYPRALWSLILNRILHTIDLPKTHSLFVAEEEEEEETEENGEAQYEDRESIRRRSSIIYYLFTQGGIFWM